MSEIYVFMNRDIRLEIMLYGIFTGPLQQRNCHYASSYQKHQGQKCSVKFSSITRKRSIAYLSIASTHLGPSNNVLSASPLTVSQSERGQRHSLCKA
jgi:hypothetical protein